MVNISPYIRTRAVYRLPIMELLMLSHEDLSRAQPNSCLHSLGGGRNLERIGAWIAPRIWSRRCTYILFSGFYIFCDTVSVRSQIIEWFSEREIEQIL